MSLENLVCIKTVQKYFILYVNMELRFVPRQLQRGFSLTKMPEGTSLTCPNLNLGQYLINYWDQENSPLIFQNIPYGCPAPFETTAIVILSTCNSLNSQPLLILFFSAGDALPLLGLAINGLTLKTRIRYL